MSELLLAHLRRKFDEIAGNGAIDAETCRSALKEELQFYVLNFIYHHPQYNKWIMYGGSALRVCHGLDRLSVDLDFEVSQRITEEFLAVTERIPVNRSQLSHVYLPYRGRKLGSNTVQHR